MKTKELIDKIKDNYEYDVHNDSIVIYSPSGNVRAIVLKINFGMVDTLYPNFEHLKNSIDLAKMLLEYALTPLDEREEEHNWKGI